MELHDPRYYASFVAIRGGYGTLPRKGETRPRVRTPQPGPRVARWTLIR